MLTDDIRIINARDLQIGDTIIDGKREITVKTIEHGPSCTGIHINVVRKETRPIMRRGKFVGLNADRGRILYSDGCWQPCARIIINRTCGEQVTPHESVLALENDSLALLDG